MSAVPAVTGVVRDMTDVRLEVPRFVPQNCTGCSQCWTQCPDSAIPGLVVEIDQLIEVGIAKAATQPNGEGTTRIRQVSRHLATETRKVLKATPSLGFSDALATAYKNVVAKLNWEGEKRAGLEEEFGRLHAKVAAFQVARTAPFFDGPEAKQAGSGGMLAITINPEACKGCNLCVDVCPDDALITVKQDAAEIAQLREQWAFWQNLPDTPDRFINVSNIDEAIGALPSLLLKKNVYRSMVGGDGACMGCGEKTAVHLVVSAIHAMMRPRVEKHVKELDGLIEALDADARKLLAGDVNLDTVASNGAAGVPMSDQKRARLALLNASRRSLEDLRWRYQEGPGGRGRAAMGMANSTGCSSVWGATYPYNPYPFPWTNHLFQDSPSLAIGLFEGHMRKMADGFVNVRRARLLTSGDYDAAKHEAELGDLTWKHFTDEEFGLCPPIVSMGGDGAMLDIGFQNLSRLLASGKPIRVIVLDTQVYSNTGGQACTSGFTGQVSDMAAFGKAIHGKTEERKELALIAIAHRGAFVHQTSQASASHLLSGVLKGLQKRRPAVINIYTPCPVEHGLADDWSAHAARLALESRAFPYLTYDPDGGATLAECLTLDGNPALDTAWPTYTLEFTSDAGVVEKLELPLTIADWAATEGRFKKHFRKLPREEWTDDCIPFAEFIALPVSERAGKTPFIHIAEGESAKLGRLAVSAEIVTLADERQRFWALLKEMAGLASASREAEFDSKLAQLTADYEAKLAALKAEYPALIARRMANALLQQGGKTTIEELLKTTPTVVPNAPPVIPPPVVPTAAPTTVSVAATPQLAPASPNAAVAVEEPEELTMEAFIESARCTTCNECTNLNNRMFAYNGEKQAYIKDPKAGTFAQLVTAAERCPVGIIHPGSPLNPREKDLAKWVDRAKKFQ
jgi:pyruvate-ferredoxin/flavodoxin oxidoreductase